MLQGPIILDINLTSHFIQREGQRDINRGKQKGRKDKNRMTESKREGQNEKQRGRQGRGEGERVTVEERLGV